MKTNFFKIINHLKSPGSWTIHISPLTDGKMIVSVLLSDPSSEKEGIVLSPMIFNQSPETLDEHLFARLMEPVAEINEIFVNVSQVQQNIENAKKLLKEKSKPGKAEPSKPDDSALKKQKYDEAIKKITELNGLCKYDEALGLLRELRDYPDKQVEIDKLRLELETKNKQLSLL
ncbi:MAG: hypothetical protein EOO90_06455 [Pedobacter sp.]|nr:MAG: hypothetical protein EOO90_06455 [Pedobacter sp.]